MSLHIERVEDWLGRPVVGPDGEQVGKLVDLIFAADSTPLFGAVSTGLFGRKTSLVPLDRASLSPEHISIPFDKDAVKSAPQLDDPAEMSAEVEAAAAEHYGIAPRERALADQGYSSATDRARRAQQAAEAEQQAVDLEQRAHAVGEDIKSAGADVQAAQERLRALIAQQQELEEQARRAREAQAAAIGSR